MASIVIVGGFAPLEYTPVTVPFGGIGLLSELTACPSAAHANDAKSSRAADDSKRLAVAGRTVLRCFPSMYLI